MAEHIPSRSGIGWTEGGFVLNEETRVHQISIREKRKRIQPPMERQHYSDTSAQLTELPARKHGMSAFFSPESLTKNLALLGCLTLVVLALQKSGEQGSVSAFSALQSEMNASWEADVGKLSFVSDLLPSELREVWNPTPAVCVTAPAAGTTIHAWSETEPYLEIFSENRQIRSAGDGEVMSIAHGPGEERILRIRHDNGVETLYGNLENCSVEIGDTVENGDVIATLLPDAPLAFEMRINGVPVDPAMHMQPVSE